MKKKFTIHVSIIAVACVVGLASFAIAQTAAAPESVKEVSGGQGSSLLKSFGLRPGTFSVAQPGGLQRTVLQQKLIRTALVIAICYLFIFIFVGVVNRRIQDLKARHVIRKNVVYLFNFLAIIIVAYVWIQDIGSIAILIGFASAGMALALQEVLLCIAGWFLIIVRRPFEVGDRIELGGVKGDVIDIRLLQTSLLEIGNWVEADQSTGRIVNIPNSFVYKKENFNYSRGFDFIWNEIQVLVTFESNWKRAKEIMLHHAQNQAEGMEGRVKRDIKSMANRYMIYYEKLTPIVYTNIKDSGVELTVRYLTEAKKRRSTQDELSRAILDDFAKENDVNFAYPTYRIVKTQ